MTPFYPQIVFPLAAALALSACAQTPVPVDSTRIDNGALYFFNDDISDGPVIDQVAALNASADQLVRASTVNGALIGVAIGCGLTALSATNARTCLLGAAVGGAGGAVIGAAVGENDVQRRTELVAANDIARDINTAHSQFANIRTDLPALLARQEADLNSLSM